MDNIPVVVLKRLTVLIKGRERFDELFHYFLVEHIQFQVLWHCVLM